MSTAFLDFVSAASVTMQEETTNGPEFARIDLGFGVKTRVSFMRLWLPVALSGNSIGRGK